MKCTIGEKDSQQDPHQTILKTTAEALTNIIDTI